MMMVKDDYSIIKTDEYRELLKRSKLLESIQEGKDYYWLQAEYKDIENKLDKMPKINFDLEGEDK